jgi:DNA helicase II / ATP-dependent DNA helicase PcrA
MLSIALHQRWFNVENKILEEALENLSLVQKKAANWSEGSLLVLAGPGSGKTRVLTCRIAKILSESEGNNFRVLALTFTNKAADEMRDRILRLAPGEEGRLFIGTFHSFCADILRQHGVHLNINPNFQIYSQDNDLKAILCDVVSEAKKDYSYVNDSHKKILPVIQKLKSNLIDPNDCEDLFLDKNYGKAISILYPAYELELEKRNALDFNSLILKTYQLFSKFPALAKRYRTVYPYICVDEFQDANEAQYKFLKSLTGDHLKNLFIVADDDQIIYQWNGASYKRLEEFEHDYSPIVIQLPVNYRCPPQIVDIANNLIQHNFLRSKNKKPLEANKTDSSEETIYFLDQFPDFEIETKEVAVHISNQYLLDPSSIVVLARSRKLLEGVEKALSVQKIKASIYQRKDEFESTPFIWLYSILMLANDRLNRNCLEAVCGSFAQLTQVSIDANDIVMQAKSGNNDFLQYWVKFARLKTPDRFSETIEVISKHFIEGRDYQSFINFALKWFKELSNNLSQNIEDPNSEYFAQYDIERSVWQELVREIHGSLGDKPPLEAFLQELQLHSKEAPPGNDTVMLMTIHGSKGKEFDHVYLVGLVEDELPSYQSKQKGDISPEMEEERRNCFVAITRARKTLTLSYSKKYRGWDKKPSRFLFEMGLLENQED